MGSLKFGLCCGLPNRENELPQHVMEGSLQVDKDGGWSVVMEVHQSDEGLVAEAALEANVSWPKRAEPCQTHQRGESLGRRPVITGNSSVSIWVSKGLPCTCTARCH